MVKIGVRNKSIRKFCYGVLISETHVLTSLECKWTAKSDFGLHPVAKFPGIRNGTAQAPLLRVCIYTPRYFMRVMLGKIRSF